jgi:hypothetical protein
MLILLHAIQILEAELNELPRTTERDRAKIAGMLLALDLMRHLLHAASQHTPKPQHFQDLLVQYVAYEPRQSYYPQPPEDDDT